MNVASKEKAHDAEYQKSAGHNVVKEEDSEDGEGVLEDDISVVQVEVVHKKKTVNVLLTFSEDKSNVNLRSFYAGLKKSYMEKMNSSLLTRIDQR